MNLASLGWNPFFEKNFASFAQEGYSVGRVALEEKVAYRLYTEAGEIWAEVSGRLRYHAQGKEELPAVGDWVVVRERSTDGKSIIHQVLPRKSKFSRKVAGARTDEQIVAANIDKIFLVMGLDNDFNPRRIERYLTLAWDSGTEPIIVLNKADLCENLDQYIREMEAVAVGAPVLVVSAIENHGVGALRDYIQYGATISLIGSSGVGKSTIINRLIGEDRQKVGEIRDSDDRGRHTTTHRELIPLVEGGLLIDTPGMREIQLWLGNRGIQEAFEDIEVIAAACRFRDCKHTGEPGCAVKAALESGELPAERFDSYKKMLSELKHFEVRHNQSLALVEKDRWKKIHQAMKKHKKKF